MVTILNVIGTVLMALTVIGMGVNFIFNNENLKEYSFYNSLLDLFLGFSAFCYVTAFVLKVFY